MNHEARQNVLRYSIAVIATAVAIGARATLAAWLGVEDLMLFLVAAVLVAAGYGGLGPGLLAVGLSTVAGAYALLPHDFGDRVRLVVFLVTGVTISIVSEYRRRAERELREADAQKTRFLATLGHELRAPLAPIRNALEVIRREGASVPTVVWASGVADRQVTHMVRLVEDLVDVHRIRRNQLELRLVSVVLGDIIAAAVETSRPHSRRAATGSTCGCPASRSR